MKFNTKNFFSKCDHMRRTSDLVTLTEKTLNGKLRFFVMFFIMWLIAYFIFSLFSWEKQPPEVFCVKNQACSFIKKETLAQVFSCEFGEISKNTFFTEHLWATASILKSLKLWQQK